MIAQRAVSPRGFTETSVSANNNNVTSKLLLDIKFADLKVAQLSNTTIDLRYYKYRRK